MWQIVMFFCCFFFQAEDGIRDLVRSRGLGDVYKRQVMDQAPKQPVQDIQIRIPAQDAGAFTSRILPVKPCLLYTSDAADERSSVDLGGRRIIKKKNQDEFGRGRINTKKRL